MQPPIQNLNATQTNANEDNDEEDGLMLITQTGVHEFDLRFDLKNSGPQANVIIKIYVNDETVFNKTYTVSAHSTLFCK